MALLKAKIPLLGGGDMHLLMDAILFSNLEVHHKAGYLQIRSHVLSQQAIEWQVRN